MEEVKISQILGNNWSYGYLHEIPEQKINAGIMSEYRQFSHQKQNQLIKKYVEQNIKISQFVLEKVRKQLQSVDCALAINVISSLGGGTGSGLGTKTVQKLSQEFNMDIFSHVVLPNMSGQTPLQIYNCLLSLSVIQEHSTAVFPLQNQKFMQYFRVKNDQNWKGQSLDFINQNIAENLSKFIKINDIPGYDRFYTDISNDHVLSPSLKYLNLTTCQSKSQNQPWEECFEDILIKTKLFNQDFSNNSTFNKRQSLLSGQIIAIGRQHFEYEKKYKKKMQNVLNAHEVGLSFSQIYSKGTHLSSLIKQQTGINDKKDKNQPKPRHEAIIIMNHSNIVRYLTYLCERGSQKYENKAYLWHYQYVDIQESLQKVQNTVDQYNFFTKNQT